MNIQGITRAQTGIPGGYDAPPVRTLSKPSADSFGPAFILDISAAAWDAYARTSEASQGCETCKNRRYRDGSNDPSVSFQTAAHIAPGQAAAAISAHEGEHASHDQIKAEQNNRKIVSQTVTLETSTCPECGRVYVSGGRTRTVTVAEPQRVDLYA